MNKSTIKWVSNFIRIAPKMAATAHARKLKKIEIQERRCVIDRANAGAVLATVMGEVAKKKERLARMKGEA